MKKAGILCFCTIIYIAVLFILLAVVLFFIFLFIPKDGELTIDTEYDTVKLESSTVNYNFGNELILSTGMMPMRVFLFYDDYTINNKKYTNGYSFITHDTTRNTVGTAKNNTQEYIIHLSSLGDITGEMESGKADSMIKSDGKIYITPIGAARLDLRATQGLRIKIEGLDMIMNNSQHGVPEDYISVEEVDYPETALITVDNLLEVKSLTERRDWGFDITCNTLKRINIDDVETIETKGTGSASFFNSANSKTFNLLHQRVTASIDEAYFQARNNRIVDGRLMFSSEVNKVDIMGYSVVPGVRGWISDNIYALPSIILTVFGGAITLAIATTKSNNVDK